MNMRPGVRMMLGGKTFGENQPNMAPNRDAFATVLLRREVSQNEEPKYA